MLIEFRVENHRSLRDEQALTMEAGRGGETDPRVRHVPGVSEALLTVAALYGANASGKSNVLSALAFMRDAVLLSHRVWSPDGGVPRDPFAWGAKRNEPSLFEVTLHLNGDRYEYGFVASDERFLEEWLYAWPNGKKQVWFERDNDVFKFGDNLKGENKLVQAVTRPNALFLSAAVQLNHLQLQAVFSWFQKVRTVNVTAGRYPLYDDYDVWQDSELRRHLLFLSSTGVEPLVQQFRKLLRGADLGVLDYTISELGGPAKPKVKLRYRSRSPEAWLPLEEASHGTQLFFQTIPSILQAIQDGGVVLVDELGASLHPLLASQIVQQFNDLTINPRGAQLIFATHHTDLLGTILHEPELRRDQIWLTEKDVDGATVLYPLTDYKPRKAENLERGYLQGRYGAVPFLADFNLLENASS